MNIPLTDIFVHDFDVTARGPLAADRAVASCSAAVFGSFLNVVAYRLPRRMSLSRPGSRCPACEQPIRWHDNVPILGWLMLRRPLPRLPAPRSRPAIRWSKRSVAAASGLLAWQAIGGLVADVGRWRRRVSRSMSLRSRFACCWCARCVAAALIEFDGHRAAARG